MSTTESLKSAPIVSSTPIQTTSGAAASATPSDSAGTGLSHGEIIGKMTLIHVSIADDTRNCCWRCRSDCRSDLCHHAQPEETRHFGDEGGCQYKVGLCSHKRRNDFLPSLDMISAEICMLTLTGKGIHWGCSLIRVDQDHLISPGRYA